MAIETKTNPALKNLVSMILMSIVFSPSKVVFLTSQLTLEAGKK
jgi:hypothetical protein